MTIQPNSDKQIFSTCCLCCQVKELDSLRQLDVNELKIVNRMFKATNNLSLSLSHLICIDAVDCDIAIDRHIKAIGKYKNGT